MVKGRMGIGRFRAASIYSQTSQVEADDVVEALKHELFEPGKDVACDRFVPTGSQCWCTL